MFKKIVILLILALAIWAVVVFWPESTARHAVETQLVWPTPATDEVAEIRLQADGKKFALVSRNGKWVVDLPDVDTDPLADREKVLALMEFVAVNKPVKRLGPLEYPNAYGLHEPRAVIAMNGKAEISIGGDSPEGDGVYAKAKDEPQLLLLPLEYVTWLTRKPEYYFDTRLFSFKEQEVRSMALQAWDGDSWEVRAEDGDYEFTSPEDKLGALVSRQEADLLLHTVLTARATDLLLSEPPGPLEELLRITLATKSARETLTVFSAGQGLVGRSGHQPLPFKLDPDLKGKLDKSAFALTDRRVLDLDLGGISRMRVSRNGRELNVERGDSAWKSADGKPDELLGIDMYLWRLTDLKYVSEPVEVRPKSARHGMTLTLWGKEAEPLAELLFFTDRDLSEDLCWIATSGEGLYYPVSARLYKDLDGLLPQAGASGQAK